MRIHYVVAALVLLQSTLCAGITPISVDGIDVHVKKNTVDLLIKTSAEPAYQVAFSRDDRLKLRIDDATGYDFTRSDNPLWKQVPFNNIALAQFYNNLYLTIGTENRENFRFSHTIVAKGIQLSFQSDRFQFGKPEVSNIRLEDTGANTLNKSEIEPDHDHIESLNQAMSQDDLNLVKSLFEELPDSKELPSEMVKNLAGYFETHGIYKISEQLWMDYYTTQINSKKVKYADAIPTSHPERGQSYKETMIGGDLIGTFISENKISLALFLVLSLVTSSGYIWYSSRESVREEGISTESSTDFLSALQSSLEPDTNENNHDIQTKESIRLKEKSGGKLPDTNVNSAQHPQEKPGNESGKQAGRKRREADRLRRLGLSTEMIARELKLSRGEVELLLKVTEENHLSTKTHRVAEESISGKTPEEIARHLQISVEEAKIMRMRQARG